MLFLLKENKVFRKYLGVNFLGAITFWTIFAFPSISLGAYALHIIGLFIGGFVLNTFSNNVKLFLPILATTLLGYFQMNLSTSVLETKLDVSAELFVRFKAGAEKQDFKELCRAEGVLFEAAFNPRERLKTELDEYLKLNIPDALNVETFLNALEKIKGVKEIEYNEAFSLNLPEIKSTEIGFSKGELAVNDPAVSQQWGLKFMQFKEMQELLEQKAIKPLKRCKIAIIDTGVEAKHEDIRANFTTVRKAYNKDLNGHGTHCAGIAGAVSNNNKGIASFSIANKFIELTSIQVADRFGGSTQERIIDGIIEAVDNGATVLSISMGGPSRDKAQLIYKKAIEYANNKGAIVIVAAGNESIDASNVVPASVPNVITVTALDSELSIAGFSNTVANLNYGIAAPGVAIYSTYIDNSYKALSGTSMATPYVAGLVGLMKAIKPDLNTAQVYKLLHETGLETSAGDESGHLIQAANVLNELTKKY